MAFLLIFSFLVFAEESKETCKNHAYNTFHCVQAKEICQSRIDFFQKEHNIKIRDACIDEVYMPCVRGAYCSCLKSNNLKPYCNK